MGKGDKKTKKGKIWKGTYGVSRKRKVRKVSSYVPAASTGKVSGEDSSPKKKATRTKATVSAGKKPAVKRIKKAVAQPKTVAKTKSAAQPKTATKTKSVAQPKTATKTKSVAQRKTVSQPQKKKKAAD